MHLYLKVPAILHSFAARMETVSATLMCATLPMTVETTVMNSDVVSQNNKTCHTALTLTLTLTLTRLNLSSRPGTHCTVGATLVAPTFVAKEGRV